MLATCYNGSLRGITNLVLLCVNAHLFCQINVLLLLLLLKKHVGRFRVVSWNVGTMTGKAMEIADVIRRRKVDMACVQEVKWKGSKARNVGHGYKQFYHGDTSNRNGVGIILREERTKDILEISRISDRIILLKLIYDTS